MAWVRLCLRAERRRRSREWLLLSVVIGGLVGGVVALVAGGARTESAYGRFLEANDAADFIGGSSGCHDPAIVDCDPRSVATLPSVEELVWGGSVALDATTAEGRRLHDDGAELIVPLDEDAFPDFPMRGSAGVLGRTLNQWTIVEGRAPERADEVAIGRDLAADLELTVGSTIDQTFDLVGPDGDGLDQSEVRPLRVVGIEISPGEVEAPGGRYLRWVRATPALGTEMLDPDTLTVQLDLTPVVGVALAEGATFEDFERERTEAGLDFAVTFFQADHARVIDESNRASARGLTIVAILLALAGALVVGQALGRSVSLAAVDHPTLVALGTRRRDRFRLSLARVLPVALGAAVLGAAVSVALSSRFPSGSARAIDPDAGLRFDGTVALGAALAGGVLVLALSALPAWREARRPWSDDRESLHRRPTAWATVLATSWLPVVAGLGLRQAMDRGRGRTAVPVRSTIAAIALATVALAGALTFRAGAERLRAEPELAGLTWDVALALSSDGGFPADEDLLRDTLESSPEVASAAVGSLGVAPDSVGQGNDATGIRELFVGEDTVVQPLVLDPVVGTLGPAIVEGRAPERPDEIALGAGTMADADLAIGDQVPLRVVDQTDFTETRGEATVVGRGVFPNLTPFGRLRDGALLTGGGARALLEPTVGDPSSRFPSGWAADLVFVDLAEGTDADELAAALEQASGLDAEPVGAPQRFLDDVDRAIDLPLLLAGAMAAAAGVLLLHALVTSVRRRGADLAVLRTMGLLKRQVRRTLGWQASTIMVAAVVVALPIGVVVGRQAWLLYADAIGVVPEPGTPGLVWLGAVLLAVIAAFGLGLLVGIRPSRRRPATLLREE